MAASGVVPALIYKQRLASFSVRPTLRRIATALMAAAQVKGARLIEERVLAGEVELVWDVRRSHPVPTALSDYDKFRRYTAFRPYLVYRHPEQSLQDSIARLRPRRLRRLSHLHPRISQQSAKGPSGPGGKTERIVPISLTGSRPLHCPSMPSCFAVASNTRSPSCSMAPFSGIAKGWQPSTGWASLTAVKSCLFNSGVLDIEVAMGGSWAGSSIMIAISSFGCFQL